MNNKEQLSSEEIKIQGLLDTFLRSNANKFSEEENHLDEDLFAAFVEGELNEFESAPVVNHLASCSFCRHISAQLIKLQDEVSNETETKVDIAEEPESVGTVLKGILTRIFGANDSAVFAHEETLEKEDKDKNKEK